ncbi:MAG TPA: alpha/beta fold hydrolase, partial [Nocardioidaceae bacterium]|nr:alpha/beta fold hydrolase [Nocardioidaceae bacterium]
MYAHRSGTGRPILLVPGLGSTWESWAPILPGLRARREVVAVDLPGFGETPPLPGEVSIAALTDSVESFVTDHGLTGVDLVGSSMGGRIVLEMARRGATGTTVALDPGGFWGDAGARYLDLSLRASIRLVRRLQPVLPAIVGNPAGRTALLSQLSARPWALPRQVVLRALRS